MNQYPEKLRRILLKVNLEFGLDVVNAGEREIIGECAVTRNVQAAAHLLDLDVVHIDNFRELAGDRLQSTFEIRIANQLVAGFDGGRFAFDMSKDVGDLRHIVAHVGFKFGDLVVRALKGHALVEFDVLLDVKLAGEILDADVVDVEVMSGGDGANAVEDVFRALGARQGLDKNIGIGKDTVDCVGYCRD